MADIIYLMFGEDACRFYADGDMDRLMEDGWGFMLMAYDPSEMTIYDIIYAHDGYMACCEITKEDYELLITNENANIYGKD